MTASTTDTIYDTRKVKFCQIRNEHLEFFMNAWNKTLVYSVPSAFSPSSFFFDTETTETIWVLISVAYFRYIIHTIRNVSLTFAISILSFTCVCVCVPWRLLHFELAFTFLFLVDSRHFLIFFSVACHFDGCTLICQQFGMRIHEMYTEMKNKWPGREWETKIKQTIRRNKTKPTANVVLYFFFARNKLRKRKTKREWGRMRVGSNDDDGNNSSNNK